MTVRVKLFAAAREIAARDQLEVEVHDGATVSEVRAAVEKMFPTLSRVLAHAMWAVDAEYADDNRKVHDGCDVAVIPPVSGG